MTGMIDVGKKKVTEREAVVEGKISIKASLVDAIRRKNIPKGDVLEAARLAGIVAAKKTAELIPLCHPLPLDYVDISFSLGKDSIKVTTTVKAVAKTGVEMEAFAATAVTLLTIYDMCKFKDRTATISDIRLIRKSGGKSGRYERK